MIDGLLIGSVYGLAAMGLSLIWGVMDVINLTHGAVIALGMFGMYILFAAFPVNAYLLLLPMIAAGLVFGTADLLDLGALGNRPLPAVEPAVHLRREHDDHWDRHCDLEHQPLQRELHAARHYGGRLYLYRKPHCCGRRLRSSLRWRWSCFCIAPGRARPSGPWPTTAKRRS